MIDTRPARLNALRAQADKLPPWEADVARLAFEAADSYLEETDRIRGERYRPEREAEELATASAAVVSDFGSVEQALVAAAAEERARAVDAWDGERMTRARDGRRLADVIDVDALTNADGAQHVRGAVGRRGAFAVSERKRARWRCASCARKPLTSNGAAD